MTQRAYARRAEKALNMAREGLSWTEIAEALNYKQVYSMKYSLTGYWNKNGIDYPDIPMERLKPTEEILWKFDARLLDSIIEHMSFSLGVLGFTGGEDDDAEEILNKIREIKTATRHDDCIGVALTEKDDEETNMVRSTRSRSPDGSRA